MRLNAAKCVLNHKIIHTNRNLVSVHKWNNRAHYHRSHISGSSVVTHVGEIVAVDNPALASIWNKNQLVILAISVTIKAALIEETREITSDNTTKITENSENELLNSFFSIFVFFVCLFYWKVAFCLHLGKHNPSRVKSSQRQRTRHTIPEYKDNMTSLSFWKHQAPPLQRTPTWHTCHESYRSSVKRCLTCLWFFFLFF